MLFLFVLFVANLIPVIHGSKKQQQQKRKKKRKNEIRYVNKNDDRQIEKSPQATIICPQTAANCSTNHHIISTQSIQYIPPIERTPNVITIIMLSMCLCVDRPTPPPLPSVRPNLAAQPMMICIFIFYTYVARIRIRVDMVSLKQHAYHSAQWHARPTASINFLVVFKLTSNNK